MNGLIQELSINQRHEYISLKINRIGGHEGSYNSFMFGSITEAIVADYDSAHLSLVIIP
jgi:hypothetical protein